MKVAVTAMGKDLGAAVDPRFGRARYFIVVDTESEDFEVLDNEQNLNAAQGAGIQSARNVSESGADALITGNCGPRAFATLSAAGIKVYIGATGTVAQAVEALKAGELQAADDPNVQAHWGGP